MNKKKQKELIMKQLWKDYDKYMEEWKSYFDDDFKDFVNNIEDDNIKDVNNKNKKIISVILLSGFVASYLAHLKTYNIKEYDRLLLEDKLNLGGILDLINGVRFNSNLDKRIDNINKQSFSRINEDYEKYKNDDIGLMDLYEVIEEEQDMLDNNYRRLIETEYSYSISQASDLTNLTIAALLTKKGIDKLKDRIDLEDIINDKVTKEDIGVETYQELIDKVGIVKADIENGEVEEIYIYNAILDAKTCNDCASLNGQEFTKDNKIDLPQHPYCRCYYDTKLVLRIDNETIEL